MEREEEIKKIEDEIKKTKYNKATQGHIGRLKAKVAKLKASSGKKGGGGGLGYNVKKTGDATVILLGFPSVGKSTLLNALTNAKSRVADFEFTTLTVIPGMLDFRGAKIQMLDIPGIIAEAASGRGRGKEVLSVVRNADLLIIILAGDWKKQKQVIEDELYNGGFRLNQKPPDVKIARKSAGGIRVESTKKLSFSKETVMGILNEFRITNGEALIRENVSLDQLIDCLAGNRKYLPALFIANKSDLTEEKLPKEFIRISALKKEGISDLKEIIWEKLELKRIYLKKPGKEPDMVEPLIIRGNVVIRNIAEKINLLKHFRFAKIWGPTARFPGQKVGLGQQLKDKDIVEIHD